MPVPKTAVHENCRSIPRKDYVWPAGEIDDVQTEAKTFSVKTST
jgi:hypothetical protein